MLAIETATVACSVALIDDGEVLDFAHEQVGRGHAERLLPMIAALHDGGRADVILVDVGPGSFTGVRVGVAAARALGFGWNSPVAGYHSLALLAAIDGWQADTAVTIEGGHGEVFIAEYRADGDGLPRSLPFDAAVAGVVAPRLIGDAAARIIAARGWGEGHAVAPDARAVVRLPSERQRLTPSPFYGREADAKPMA